MHTGTASAAVVLLKSTDIDALRASLRLMSSLLSDARLSMAAVAVYEHLELRRELIDDLRYLPDVMPDRL